jgi:hypothetical protein
VTYGQDRLCNGCATDYELLRTAGFDPDTCPPQSTGKAGNA